MMRLYYKILRGITKWLNNKNNRKGSGNYRENTGRSKSGESVNRSGKNAGRRSPYAAYTGKDGTYKKPDPEKPEDHPMQEEPTPTTDSLKKKVRLPITSGELRLRMQGIQLEKSLKILR